MRSELRIAQVYPCCKIISIMASQKRAYEELLKMANASLPIMERAMKALAIDTLTQAERQQILDGIKLLTDYGARSASAIRQKSQAEEDEFLGQVAASAERIHEELMRFAELVDRLLAKNT